ncbi:2-amino-4-hydroxy-6-hydroxymethyldihydropteridine diphosphokinase [Leuconostoc rapi]|uniref:2-amino-4-hydroxy-6- hydroxymethyldihydropteridine diphosphokinase n=1 Tax=Leuconostoc rapi TaxID=1406906 RepID=UPI001956A73F|nr:2-amino-4-hydroxy-6-hydroxymethyldihydropteridine diphosphokinase [Leuconostoc rapi]MBM7435017.1 2-amino-4-hydroxy-6-hydroxymethyldihydropteridine diphosphokinase [Leuconostoc rapi]
MTVAYLSLGANIGDRLANLQQAVTLLQKTKGIDITDVSNVYETQPVGGVVQDDFYNLAVRIDTELSAPELLTRLHEIESHLKRVRKIHWGPRTIDIDILLFGDDMWSDDTLTVPHREMANRRFVLTPLLDVVSDDRRYEIENLLAHTADTNWIRAVANVRVENDNI